jgi:hypothetical protein
MEHKNHQDARKHKNDLKPPKGFQYVRVDGYESSTPTDERVYVQVPTGYGEGARAMVARDGVPNIRKIFQKAKKQAASGRRARIILPPLPRMMREAINAQKVGGQL